MGKHNRFTKEQLYQLYIIEDKNQREVALELNSSLDLIQKTLSKFNIKKSKKCIANNRAKTNLKKYGVLNQFQNPSIKEKIKKTSLMKYGVENPIQNKDVKTKAVKTMIEKYGTEVPLRNGEIQNKFKETNLERYGVSNPSQSEESKNKVRFKMLEANRSCLILGKTPKEWARKYNVPATSLYNWIGENSQLCDQTFFEYLTSYKRTLTDIENIVVKEFNVDFWNKNCHGLHYKPDFKINEFTYLNVDGLYFHSNIYRDKFYHFKLREDFEKQGLKIFQFRSNEIYEKLPIIKSILGLTNKKHDISLKNMIIKAVCDQDAKKFLEANHIKGSIVAKHVGLYLENELMFLISYKICKDNNKKNIKIERICFKLNLMVFGACGTILEYIRAINDVDDMSYFADLRYESGQELMDYGFKIKSEFLRYEWTDFKSVYKTKTSRCETKIYDAGQRLLIR
jgi:hypothetical protein